MLFPDDNEGAIYIRRSDCDELFGTYSAHPFRLDSKEWLTVEHYFQAMKFERSNQELFEQIRSCSSPKLARKYGRRRFKKIRGDWSKVKSVVMTRAFYTKCRTYDEIAERLLETGDSKILENSQYDYYWGCGRDRRGENIYGEVVMDVRKKLFAEAESGLQSNDSV